MLRLSIIKRQHEYPGVPTGENVFASLDPADSGLYPKPLVKIMREIQASEAKTLFSSLLDAVEPGETLPSPDMAELRKTTQMPEQVALV